MRGLLGILFLLFLAWALGERRRGDRERRIPWRTVIVGLGLQAALAVLLLRFPPASHVLLLLNRAALALQEATDRGTAFVFGYLTEEIAGLVEPVRGADALVIEATFIERDTGLARARGHDAPAPRRILGHHMNLA